jgi:hypothetical protein
MTAINFGWKRGSRVKLDAQTAGERVEKIRTANGGDVNAEMIVKDARSKRSPLHDGFEWSNPAAAHKYRLVQARKILHGLVVVSEEEDVEPRRYYAVVTYEGETEDGTPETVSAYTSVDDAFEDPALREQILARAWSDLAAFRKRYKSLKELAHVFDALSSVGA